MLVSVFAHLVSIHAPWEGCDLIVISKPYPSISSFNSRTLGRVRLGKPLPTPRLSVSIHAPWEGCDKESDYFEIGKGVFQFTHPGKGATIRQ